MHRQELFDFLFFGAGLAFLLGLVPVELIFGRLRKTPNLRDAASVQEWLLWIGNGCKFAAGVFWVFLVFGASQMRFPGDGGSRAHGSYGPLLESLRPWADWAALAAALVAVFAGHGLQRWLFRRLDRRAGSP
jgi:hypothetical protein